MVLLAPNGDALPRVLTSHSARRLGFTEQNVRSQLERQRWQLMARGVWLTRPDPPRRSDWLVAGLAIGGDGAAVSGWDAVRAYGLGPDRPIVDDVLVLTRSGSHRRCGRAWIRPSRRLLAARRRIHPEVGRLLTAPPARAIADMSLECRTLTPVRAVVTAAGQAGICTLDDLDDELATGPRNGSGHLRRAIQDLRLGAASIAEAELSEILRAAGLPPFEQNIVVLDADGRHIATVDVLWRSLRAALEVDSQKHHFLAPQWRSTMRRHNLLTSGGLAVTHYPPVDVRDRRAAVVDEIEAWLTGRARELGTTYPPADRTDPSSGAPFTLSIRV